MISFKILIERFPEQAADIWRAFNANDRFLLRLTYDQIIEWRNWGYYLGMFTSERRAA